MELQQLLADRSLPARTREFVDHLLWSGEDSPDPAAIFKSARTHVLDERQRGTPNLEDRLRHQIEDAIAADRHRSESQRAYLNYDLATYAADMIADGIVGGASFELLKYSVQRARGRLRSRGKSLGARPSPGEVLDSYVKLAVIEQCRRHDLPVPDPGDLRVTTWRHSAGSSTAYIRERGQQSAPLQATVVVSHENLALRGAEVTITKPTGPVAWDGL